MFSLLIFWASAIAGVILLALSFTKLKITKKPAYFCLGLALLVLSLSSITPYILNERDAARIDTYNQNVGLYQAYINEYTDAAQKQISEYQQMQSQMAKTANSTQLQYFSAQVDAVGNALTNRIKEFKDDIMKEQLSINKMVAQIKSRSKNKWFFWAGLTK